jgi:hypothetical protein
VGNTANTHDPNATSRTIKTCRCGFYEILRDSTKFSVSFYVRFLSGSRFGPFEGLPVEMIVGEPDKQYALPPPDASGDGAIGHAALDESGIVRAATQEATQGGPGAKDGRRSEVPGRVAEGGICPDCYLQAVGFLVGHSPAGDDFRAVPVGGGGADHQNLVAFGREAEEFLDEVPGDGLVGQARIVIKIRVLVEHDDPQAVAEVQADQGDAVEIQVIDDI